MIVTDNQNFDGLREEIKKGLAGTVALFRTLGLKDFEIAQFFRDAADAIDPPQKVLVQ